MGNSRATVAAVDLGGTDTKMGLITRDGQILARTRIPTALTAFSDGDGGRGTVDWLGDRIAEFIAAEQDRQPVDVVGFGVIVPGIIDAEAGLVRAAPNIGWTDIELAAPLSRRLGRTGRIGHDVRTAGLAEWQLGAGRGVSDLLFVPLGTGIAAAMMVDGHLLEAGGYAGEIGHIAVPAAESWPCACGGSGCLEVVASAAGVARTYRRLSGAPLDDREAATVTAVQVAESARAGEPSAVRTFDIAGTALAEAFTIAATLLGPEVIVIGGGLSGAADLLLPRIESEFDQRLRFQRRPKLMVSTFGSSAGLVGAGLLGWSAA